MYNQSTNFTYQSCLNGIRGSILNQPFRLTLPDSFMDTPDPSIGAAVPSPTAAAEVRTDAVEQGRLATTTAAYCDALEHYAREAKTTHETALARANVECERTMPRMLARAAPAHAAQERAAADPPLDDDTSDAEVDDTI